MSDWNPHGHTISCDECAMSHTVACADCVVTFVLHNTLAPALEFTDDEARVVQLLGRAGLVPRLRFEAVG